MDKLVAKGAYTPALAKYDSLKSLDALMDNMSSIRASGTCDGHVNFYAEAGKLSLGDMNAAVAGIKTCTCNAQTYCTGNTVSCDCNSDWECTAYSCDCVGVDECRCVGDGYTDGQCWTHEGYMECPSDSGVNCSCDTESCTCNSVCACNAETSCSCNVNSVCSCNSHFS